MAMTEAKHNVAYHFQNDADTLPVVMAAVQSRSTTARWTTRWTSWCGTSRRTACARGWLCRTVRPIHHLRWWRRRWHLVVIAIRHPTRCSQGGQKNLSAVADKIYADFNKENGTNYKFQLKE